MTPVFFVTDNGLINGFETMSNGYVEGTTYAQGTVLNTEEVLAAGITLLTMNNYYRKASNYYSLPTQPSQYHYWDLDSETWIPQNSLKPEVYSYKIQELEQQAYTLLQDSITYVDPTNPSNTITLKANDAVRLRFAGASKYSTIGLTSIRVIDDFDDTYTVTTSYIEGYYTSIIARDEDILDQLVDFKNAALALLNDPTKTPQDIAEYYPSFVVPTYPYY